MIFVQISTTKSTVNCKQLVTIKQHKNLHGCKKKTRLQLSCKKLQPLLVSTMNGRESRKAVRHQLMEPIELTNGKHHIDHEHEQVHALHMV